MRARFLAILGASLALMPISLAVYEKAAATSLANLSDEQMTDASTYVIRGTVTRVWAEEDESGIVWTRAAVKVTHVYKGVDDPVELVIDSPGGRIGNRTTPMEASARFSVGEDILTYLDVIAGGRLTPVAMGLGKYTIRRAPHDDRPAVVRYAPNAAEPYDARFIPSDPIESRRYFEDVEAAIESRLDLGWDGEPIPGISNERLQQINELQIRRRK